jgi:hypothetical protein
MDGAVEHLATTGAQPPVVFLEIGRVLLGIGRFLLDVDGYGKLDEAGKRRTLREVRDPNPLGELWNWEGSQKQEHDVHHSHLFHGRELAKDFPKPGSNAGQDVPVKALRSAMALRDLKLLAHDTRPALKAL